MKNFKIPHVFIFLFWIIIICSILSYVIPSGSFERTTKDYGSMKQTVVVPNSYKVVSKNYSLKAVIIGEDIEGKSSPVSILGVFSAIPKGLGDSAVLIFYVFIIGALFSLIQQTGTINAFLFSLIAKFKNRPKLLLFLIYMTVFSGASFMGIASETIALVPVFLFLSKRLGYDRLFGFALLSVPVYLGWSSGVTNPFNVQIAQIIAELPIGSGIGFRLILFVVYAAIGFYFITRYGDRIKKKSSYSLMKNDPFNLDEFGSFDKENLEKKHIYILLFFVLSYTAILIAVQTIGWGLIEMSACFIGILIVVTKIAGMSGDESMAAFTKGLQIMIVPALVIGVARGISVVLQEGMIIDTLLYNASEVLMSMSKTVAAEGMFFFQSGLNFFIPSASGQALVSMPLMTPMADILGISRQTAVLAYILGDGLSNLIIPTNGVLMAMLGLAKVSYEKWFKLVLPLFIASMILALVFIAIAIWIGY
ncbi:YfcC family protein [Namhaeicola litoreus]|uniref:YfcC family protein n=1 Tax=Namhaeicola litoreus TaxID=1052145 RepID=A0ABW3Y1I7_9FLAO